MTVLCITPNPALDRTLMVAGGLRPGEVHRVTEVVEMGGGKGLNVARFVDQLGGRSLTVAPLAGSTGRRVARLVADEGLEHRWCWLATGQTRTCTIIAADRRATVLNEAGAMTPDDWSSLVATATAAATDPSVRAVTVSGSLAGGLQPDALVSLVSAVRVVTGAPMWIDTSGAALAAAVQLDVAIKVNLDEAASIVGTGSVVGVARRLAERSCSGRVVVTDGANGAVLVTDDDIVHLRPPPIDVSNATGSGDALLAGLVVAGAQGDGDVDALRLAIAAGASNAIANHPCVDGAHVATLMAQITERGVAATKGCRHG